jgi:hypothetical protein
MAIKINNKPIEVVVGLKRIRKGEGIKSKETEKWHL